MASLRQSVYDPNPLNHKLVLNLNYFIDDGVYVDNCQGDGQVKIVIQWKEASGLHTSRIISMMAGSSMGRRERARK